MPPLDTTHEPLESQWGVVVAACGLTLMIGAQVGGGAENPHRQPGCHLALGPPPPAAPS